MSDIITSYCLKEPIKSRYKTERRAVMSGDANTADDTEVAGSVPAHHIMAIILPSLSLFVTICYFPLLYELWYMEMDNGLTNLSTNCLE